MDIESYTVVGTALVLLGYIAGFAMACGIFQDDAKVMWRCMKDFVAQLRDKH